MYHFTGLLLTGASLKSVSSLTGVLFTSVSLTSVSVTGVSSLTDVSSLIGYH